MTYPLISTYNITDPLDIFIYVNDVSGNLFIPLFLFAFFMIIMLGSFFAQRREGTNPNIMFSFGVAGMMTFFLSVLMSLKPNLISLPTLVITLAVAVVGGLAILLAGDREY